MEFWTGLVTGVVSGCCCSGVLMALFVIVLIGLAAKTQVAEEERKREAWMGPEDNGDRVHEYSES
jgi:hypothetical protein